MPHISIKMLEGRTQQQKEITTQKVAKALQEALGVSNEHISVAIEDFTAKEWQEVFKNEIEGNKNIYKAPEYDPKDLL